MGILEPERTDTGPHPRKEPRFDGPLTLESLGRVFEGCVDYMERQVYLHGDRERTVTVCYLLGMTRNERLSDYILRPLAQDPALSRAPEEELFSLLQYGALYNLAANRRTALEDVVNDLILGSCALFFPGRADALTLPVPTEEKRSVGEPENEPALKGVRESFVESIRTNTAMVRRHLKAPELKIREHIVGRRSRTQVDVLYLEGIADPETVERLRRRLDKIDIDGVEAAGNLEEYLVDHLNTPFPTMPYTQRPDRFCQGLLEGRVGLMADGLPFAWMLPGTIDQFFKTGQDRAFHWMTASVLNLVRWFCALVTVLLPGLYIAVAIAGVAGYTMPSQDFAAALRLWRFLLAILASAAGLFGLAAGCAGLIYHLASLETFGVPYLAPFTAGAGQPQGHPNLLRPPLPRMKWRDGARHTENRRNQR